MNSSNKQNITLERNNLASIKSFCDESLQEFALNISEHIDPKYWYCNECNLSYSELDILFSSQLCHPNLFSYLHFIYFAYGLIFVASLTGNFLVLCSVIANRSLRTVTNFFICNLAVGDFLMTIFCVLPSVVSIIVLQRWPFPEFLCIIVNYFQAAAVFVSAYTMVAISIDRYLAIIYPLRPRTTKAQAKKVIALVWLMALLTTFPVAMFSGLHESGQRVYEFYDWRYCAEKWPYKFMVKFYTLALMILQYFFPLVVIVVTYSRIAYKVWGSPSIRAPVTSSFSSATNRDTLAQSPQLRRNIKGGVDRSPAKLTRITLTVVFVYSVCWLPFNVLNVSSDFSEELRSWSQYHHLWFICHWLAMSHTVYNPLILCWMNGNFRSTFAYLLWEVCQKDKRSQNQELQSSCNSVRSRSVSSRINKSRDSDSYFAGSKAQSFTESAILQ